MSRRPACTSQAMRLLCVLLAFMHAIVSTNCASSRRQLQQGATMTLPFDNLPALPFANFQQQQQQQQQPPQQQQQQPPNQQGPNNQQPQQGPQQQPGPQQQQQGNIDNLAQSSINQYNVAHAPSIGFGAPTPAANVGLQLPGYIQRAQMPPTFAYAPAPVPAQGPASMPQEELQTEAPPAANPAGDTCLALTKQLVTGMCLPFMAQFQTSGPAMAKMSEMDFRQAVAIGPTPSDRCCKDQKDFVTAACACNSVADAAAPSAGLTEQELRLSAKAAVMACPNFHFTDPCAQA